MKFYSIIAFVSAAVHFSLGITICRNKLKDFVSTICKNPARYKTLGRYFIAAGVIMLGCGFAALIDSAFALIYLAVSAVIVSIIISLIRKENI